MCALNVYTYNFNSGGVYTGNATFSWNFGIHASPSSSIQLNPTNVIYNSPGVYPVIFTVTENWCSKSVTDSVHVYPEPLALFGLTTQTGCALNPVQFIDNSVSAVPLTYSWSFGNGTTSISQNPTVIYSSAGTYNVSLMVTNQYGCKDTATLPNALMVYASPIAGFSLTPAITSIAHPDIVMIDQSSLASGCEVFWGEGTSSGNCDSMHHYTNIGTFTVMQVVVNSLGCYDTAYSEITIQAEFFFWVPNAFTPNKNELNEFFKPKVIGVHEYSFLIFDRWGGKIFETSDTSVGWNGYYKNKLCKEDVYVYKISFKDDVQNEFHQYIGKVILLK